MAAELNQVCDTTEHAYKSSSHNQHHNKMIKYETKEKKDSIKNVQAYQIANEMKSREHSNEEQDKSTFLRAVELSPCKLKNINTEADSAYESCVYENICMDLGITSERNYESSGEHLVKSADTTGGKQSYKMTTESRNFEEKIDLNASEQTLLNNPRDANTGSNETLTSQSFVVTDNCQRHSAVKDVHFCSPVAVVHEYNISQTLCSQGTISLTNTDNSENNDIGKNDSNPATDELYTKENIILPDSAKFVNRVTSGGDCYSVKANYNIAKAEISRHADKTVTEVDISSSLPQLNNSMDLLEEGRNNETITLDNEETGHLNKMYDNFIQSSQDVREEDSESKVSHDISTTGSKDISTASFSETDFNSLADIASEKHSKSYPLEDQCINRPKQCNKIFGPEPYSGEIKRSPDRVHKNGMDVTQETKDTTSEISELFKKSEASRDMVNETRKELIHKTENESLNQKCFGMEDNFFLEELYGSQEELRSQELSLESCQDLFIESLPEIKDTFHSHQSVLPSQTLLIDDKNCHMLSQADTSTQSKNQSNNNQMHYKRKDENCNSSETNVTDMAPTTTAPCIVDAVESQATVVHPDENNEERGTCINEDIVLEDYDGRSQQDLFESDIPSGTVSCVKDLLTSSSCGISTGIEDVSSNVIDKCNLEMITVSAETKNNVILMQTKVSGSDTKFASDSLSVTEMSQILKTFTGSPLSDKTACLPNLMPEGEKRKLEESNDILESKKFKSDEQISKPDEYHNLVKTLTHDGSEIPAKKAKLCATEKETVDIQDCLVSDDTSFPESLASIACRAVINLKEDTIWIGKISHDAADKEEKKGEKVTDILTQTDEPGEHIRKPDQKQNISVTETKTDTEESKETSDNISYELLNMMERKSLKIDSYNIDKKVEDDTKGSKRSNNSSSYFEIEKKTVSENSGINILESKPLSAKMEMTADTEAEVNKNPVFMTALEYHSQCSQESSTGFEPKILSENLVVSSQGSSNSVPIIDGVGFHSVTEVSEDGLEKIDISSTAVNYGTLLDSLVDEAVDHVVPDGLETEEQLTDTADDSAESLYRDSPEALKREAKVYACDVDICDKDGSPVCKALEEASDSLGNLEGPAPSAYSKCFNWNYTPSCDSESEIPLPQDSEDTSTVKIIALNTCGKPIRVGLSRRQRVSHLHNLK